MVPRLRGPRAQVPNNQAVLPLVDLKTHGATRTWGFTHLSVCLKTEACADNGDDIQTCHTHVALGDINMQPHMRPHAHAPACTHTHMLYVSLLTLATIHTHTATYTGLLRYKDTPINTPMYTDPPHLHMDLYTLVPTPGHVAARTQRYSWNAHVHTFAHGYASKRADLEASLLTMKHTEVLAHPAGPLHPPSDTRASRPTSKDTHRQESRAPPQPQVPTHRHSLKHSDPI